MKKLPLLIVILCVFTISLFALKIHTMGTAQPLHTDPSPPLSSSLTIGQEFAINHDNLSKVDVLFATFNRRHQGEIIFHLKEAPDSSQDLRTVSVDAAKIRDNEYHSFVFTPVRGSKERPLFFSVSSRRLKPTDIFIWWADTTSQKKAYVNGSLLNGDLVYRAYYKTTLFNGLRARFQQIAENKPFCLKKSIFYVFLFSLYGLLVIIFMISIRGIDKSDFS